MSVARAMTACAESRRLLGFALRFALRELRGGLRGFGDLPRLHRARRRGDRRRRLGLSAALTDGLAREGRAHSRRRHVASR